jgi:hypothetical protein
MKSVARLRYFLFSGKTNASLKNKNKYIFTIVSIQFFM